MKDITISSNLKALQGEGPSKGLKTPFSNRDTNRVLPSDIIHTY